VARSRHEIEFDLQTEPDGKGGGRVVTDLLGRGKVAAAGGLSLELSPPHSGAGGGRRGWCRLESELEGAEEGSRLGCTLGGH